MLVEDGAADVAVVLPAAVRLVDLKRKYHISPQQLADRRDLSTLKAAALRRHLGIADDDDRYCHVFDFGVGEATSVPPTMRSAS